MSFLCRVSWTFFPAPTLTDSSEGRIESRVRLGEGMGSGNKKILTLSDEEIGREKNK